MSVLTADESDVKQRKEQFFPSRIWTWKIRPKNSDDHSSAEYKARAKMQLKWTLLIFVGFGLPLVAVLVTGCSCVLGSEFNKVLLFKRHNCRQCLFEWAFVLAELNMDIWFFFNNSENNHNTYWSLKGVTVLQGCKWSTDYPSCYVQRSKRIVLNRSLVHPTACVCLCRKHVS